MIALELRGVRTRYSPTQSLPPGMFRLSFGTDLRKVKALRVEEALALSFQRTVFVCRAPSFICLTVVLMLSANSFLFLGRRLLILRTWRGGPVRLRALQRRRGHTRRRSPP